jgi:hypothetical protein
MVQHSEQKKTEFLTRVLQGRDSKGRIPLLKDDIKRVTRCSTILGNDANTRLAHFSLAVVGGRPSACDKGDQGADQLA